MKRFTLRLWAVLMLMLVSMQSMATDTFTANRTDFRDESIYFMMTTRFYDGDTGNNVLCWDNQSEQIKTKDPCWRGDFQGVIDKLDYIKALGFHSYLDYTSSAERIRLRLPRLSCHGFPAC